MNHAAERGRRPPGGEIDEFRSRPSALVYGAIAVAALLAAESAQRETYGDTIGAVMITLVLYWLAHSYAEITGQRLQLAEGFTLTRIARTMAHELYVLVGAALPLFVLLIWWAVGARLTAAVIAAVWTSVVTILGIELSVAFRSQLSGWALLVHSAFGATIGLLVIALRVLLH